jgi:hypothetical protein
LNSFALLSRHSASPIRYWLIPKAESLRAMAGFRQFGPWGLLRCRRSSCLAYRSPRSGRSGSLTTRRRGPAMGTNSPQSASLQPGTVLVREWDSKPQRVMVLDQGFAWNDTTYRSLTEIAFAITGTRWRRACRRRRAAPCGGRECCPSEAPRHRRHPSANTPR